MTSRLDVMHLSDFTGGLVTKHPASELELNQSPDLDNINLLAKGIKKRQGDSTFNSSAMDSGADVQGLGYYRPVSGTKYLVSITGTKIYKSDDLDGTMDDITAALTITANQNNIWTHSILKDLSIWVGGAPDAPIKWSGSGNAAALGGTPNSGNFGFTTRDRMFIGNTAANPSTLYWSVLADPEDWSGTGSGNTTVVTNDGDVLIGATPLNNDIVLLFKRYSIHYLVVSQSPFPVKPFITGTGLAGKHAAVNINGVVYFVTNEPRLKATDGYRIIDLPDAIDDVWDDINKARLEYIQLVYYPTREQLFCYVSKGSSQTTNNYAIIWDLRNNCFLRQTTNSDVNVATVADGYRLFGGHYDGILYEKDTTDQYYDDSETDPGTINAYWYSKWITLKNNIITKHPRYFNVSAKAITATNILKYAYGFDYAKDIKSGQFSIQTVGGQWGVDLWGSTFIWGGELNVQKRIFTFGRGNSFQLKLYNDVYDQDFQIDAIDIALKSQGVKEISAV